jgi:DNA-damage-inducible protein D
MANEITKTPPTGNDSPFERIKRTNAAGNEYWSSRGFAQILGYSDYRNFEQVIKKAKAACFNSGHRIEDHFVDITEMIEIGKGGQRPVHSVYMSRYACYLIVQNADPSKEIVALGQTYFAVLCKSSFRVRQGRTRNLIKITDSSPRLRRGFGMTVSGYAKAFNKALET